MSYAWCLVPLDELVERSAGGRLSAADAPHILGTVARIIDRGREGDGIRLDMELAFGSERRRLLVRHRSRGSVVEADVPGAEAVRSVAAPGTFAETLAGLAEQYRSGTPLTPAQMLWYLLTDEPPEIRPLSIGVRRELGAGLRLRTVVAIEAEPWVPVRAVEAAYREARAESLGRANRPLRERSLELARFEAMEGWGQSLSRRVRAWATLHPEWAVRDRRNYRTAARRAVDLLLGPPTKGAGDPPIS